MVQELISSNFIFNPPQCKDFYVLASDYPAIDRIVATIKSASGQAFGLIVAQKQGERWVFSMDLNYALPTYTFKIEGFQGQGLSHFYQCRADSIRMIDRWQMHVVA